MKAYDIYEKALALMFEVPGEDKSFKRMYLPILNVLTEECLRYENSVRESKGEEKLLRAPKITDAESDIPYCDELCNVALPYGLASFFYQDDGEGANAVMYRNRYISALDELAKINFCDIENVYGGDDI